MQVDRGRFLFFAASIAAGACASRQEIALTDGAPKVAAPIEMEPPEPGAAVPEAPAEPRPAAPPPSREPSSELRETCRSITPPPGPFCESFQDTKGQCERYGDVLEPEAAEAAVGCLARRSGRAEICDFELVSKCFVEGARSAPPQSSARQACRSVVSNCASAGWSSPDMNQPSCEAAIAGVRDELDNQLVACMTEGCGIGSCIWLLSPP